MSTGAIIAIVVVALIILALLVLLPRMRGAAEQKKAQRELQSRRENVAGEHRQAAAAGESRAEVAERRARIAEREAQRDRAEAQAQKERAELHDRGLADDELIDDSERDRFADVTGPDNVDSGRGTDAEVDVDRDRDGHTLDDRARAATDRDQQDGSVSSDYERGREDEREEERRER
jgi:hypothetical protein